MILSHISTINNDIHIVCRAANEFSQEKSKILDKSNKGRRVFFKRNFLPGSDEFITFWHTLPSMNCFKWTKIQSQTFSCCHDLHLENQFFSEVISILLSSIKYHHGYEMLQFLNMVFEKSIKQIFVMRLPITADKKAKWNFLLRNATIFPELH